MAKATKMAPKKKIKTSEKLPKGGRRDSGRTIGGKRKHNS